MGWLFTMLFYGAAAADEGSKKPFDRGAGCAAFLIGLVILWIVLTIVFLI